MSVNDFDQELLDRIEDLTELGHLEKGSASYGIALQVTHAGLSSLSPNQRAVYEKHVLPALAMPLNEEEEFRQALRRDQADESKLVP